MNLDHRLTRSIVAAKAALALLTLLVPGTAQVWAQAVSTGAISGQVIDEQNAAVAGATVKITDTATNIVLSKTTNDTGRYVISGVTPGTYNIGITKVGFSAFDVIGQPVDVGVSLVLNAKMKVGPMATTIEVTASLSHPHASAFTAILPLSARVAAPGGSAISNRRNALLREHSAGR